MSPPAPCFSFLQFASYLSDWEERRPGGHDADLDLLPTALDSNVATVGGGFTISGPAGPISLVVVYNGEFGNGRQIIGVTGGFRLTF